MAVSNVFALVRSQTCVQTGSCNYKRILSHRSVATRAALSHVLPMCWVWHGWQKCLRAESFLRKW